MPGVGRAKHMTFMTLSEAFDKLRCDCGGKIKVVAESKTLKKLCVDCGKKEQLLIGIRPPIETMNPDCNPRDSE